MDTAEHAEPARPLGPGCVRDAARVPRAVDVLCARLRKGASSNAPRPLGQSSMSTTALLLIRIGHLGRNVVLFTLTVIDLAAFEHFFNLALPQLFFGVAMPSTSSARLPRFLGASLWKMVSKY